MDKKELDFILKQGEGYNVEFKESLPNDLGREFCAFANASGGKILIGVSDDGTIKGITNSNRLTSQIQDIARNLNPIFQVGVDSIENVIVITIPEGTNKPYSANGKFFMRYGSNTQQLERDEIREFFEKEGHILFDEKVNSDFDLNKDLNKEAFETFLLRAKIKTKIDRIDLLDNLELLKDKKMKNAGVILFCNSITKFFPGLTIMCVVFQGKERLKIINSEEYVGDLFSNYERALNFLKTKLNTEYVIRTAGPREEKLELPEEALREAILNAIAHRSYFIRGSIQINIFSDRVEITNPGGLVPGLLIEELGKKSRPRNSLLFGIMQRMELVEKVGTGIFRINEAMENYKLQKPKIEADENWFSIIFKRPDLTKESYEDRLFGKKRLVEGLVEGLVENQRKILDLIIENPRISKRELAERLGISTTAIDKNLSKLKEKGLLVRVGPDKGGHWEIVDNKKEVKENGEKNKRG